VAILFHYDGGFLRAAAQCWDGSHINIVAEAKPSGGWDWTVWHSSKPKLARSGTAGTIAEAAAKVEAFAGLLMGAASAAAGDNSPPAGASAPGMGDVANDNG
jgi:hypothetical protein